MRVVSTRFRTLKRLDSFIKSSVLSSREDTFVQIVLPSDDSFESDSFRDIVKVLESFFSKDAIFAIQSDGSLINSIIATDIVINFFLVKKSTANIKYYKNIYEYKDDKDNFCLVFAANTDKKSFSSLSLKSETIASFHHQLLYHDGSVFQKGIISFCVQRYFKTDINVINSIEYIGKELKELSLEEGYIKNIENFTPKELYKHYLTKELAEDLKVSSYNFPLLKMKEDGFDSSLILDEKDDSIKVEYDLKEDDILKLGYTNNSEFYKRYDSAIKHYHDKKSDLFLVFSSIARKDFFQQNGFEFEEGVGIFTKSELYFFDDKKYDLTHSIMMVNIFYDKKKNILKKRRFKPLKVVSNDFVTLDALANIAKVSSQELEKLNKKLEKKVKIEVEKNLKKDSILIHRSRLAQMGEMMSLIAHQWKQPLSAISATSSGLHIKIELDMYDKEFFLKSLSKIEELVNHLSTTIDDFSNFFKPSKVKKEFYLYEAINKALSIATYSLSKKSIDIVLDVDKSLRVKTFQNELIQVLLNIIKNAENILVKREIKAPKIYIRAYQDGDKKIIEIEDNAGGIDKKIISKIFEPYFSTKATKDSTGLGLYMSRFIVEDSLGGELRVRNSKNGAVFSIVLV